MQNEDISERDQQLLKYLAVLMAHATQQPAKPSEKGFWGGLGETLRTPSVVATLITVLVGGIVATWISGRIQLGLKEREFNQGLMKSESDQALVQYTKYLDQEQALISRVYVLIGQCTTAADDLIGLRGKDWRNRPGAASQVSGILQNYNTTKAKWDSGLLEIEQLMGYYHPKHPEVEAAWRKIPDALDRYFQCARSWYDDPKYKPPQPAPDPAVLKDACKDKYNDLVTKLSELTKALALAQPHPGERLEIQQENKASPSN